MCAQVSPAPPVGLGLLQAAAVVKSTVLRSASRLPQTNTEVRRQADGLTRRLTAAQNHIAIVGGRARVRPHPRTRGIAKSSLIRVCRKMPRVAGASTLSDGAERRFATARLSTLPRIGGLNGRRGGTREDATTVSSSVRLPNQQQFA